MLFPTQHLKGPALNWAVAICEKYQNIYPGRGHTDPARAHVVTQILVSDRKQEMYDFKPDTNWNQCGPIIHRELIRTAPVWQLAGSGMGGEDGNWIWRAEATDPWVGFEMFGPTPMIAAMRCCVAKCLGYNVDVPDELLDGQDLA